MIREHQVKVGSLGADRRLEVWRAPLAHVAVIRGKEIEVDGRRVPETVYRMTFDYWDIRGLREDHNLEWEGRLFDIKAVMPDEATKDETVVEAIAMQDQSDQIGDGEGDSPPDGPPRPTSDNEVPKGAPAWP